MCAFAVAFALNLNESVEDEKCVLYSESCCGLDVLSKSTQNSGSDLRRMANRVKEDEITS